MLQGLGAGYQFIGITGGGGGGVQPVTTKYWAVAFQKLCRCFVFTGKPIFKAIKILNYPII